MGLEVAPRRTPSGTRLFSRSDQPRGLYVGFAQRYCPSLMSALSSGSWADGADGNNLANVDEQISCTYQIENVGTQTLAAFCLTDDNAAGGDDGCIDCGDEANVDSPPLGGFSCTTTYKVRYMVRSRPLLYVELGRVSHGDLRPNPGQGWLTCGTTVARVGSCLEADGSGLHSRWNG